jgi:hypothetical protein
MLTVRNSGAGSPSLSAGEVLPQDNGPPRLIVPKHEDVPSQGGTVVSGLPTKPDRSGSEPLPRQCATAPTAVSTCVDPGAGENLRCATTRGFLPKHALPATRAVRSGLCQSSTRLGRFESSRRASGTAMVVVGCSASCKRTSLSAVAPGANPRTMYVRPSYWMRSPGFTTTLDVRAATPHAQRPQGRE